jgi:hypothetical protein
MRPPRLAETIARDHRLMQAARVTSSANNPKHRDGLICASASGNIWGATSVNDTRGVL